MIQSFCCTQTQTLFETGQSDALAHVGRAGLRKLQLLDSTNTLEALKAAPGNDFQIAKTPNLKHSIHVEASYRLYFFWHEDSPTQVAITTCLAPKEELMQNNLPPTHPGEILREDYLRPLGMSNAALAHALHVPAERIEALVHESSPIDAEMALRLTQYFGGDPQSWLSLQQSYDLKHAEQRLLDTIIHTIQPLSHSSTHHHTRHT